MLPGGYRSWKALSQKMKGTHHSSPEHLTMSDGLLSYGPNDLANNLSLLEEELHPPPINFFPCLPDTWSSINPDTYPHSGSSVDLFRNSTQVTSQDSHIYVPCTSHISGVTDVISIGDQRG